ncbi:PilQ [Roseibium sp. TrichSKD4]|uniref:pilus assembly protein N-terminal domain-containing protein n=1 Tax=Roseibium sp. TrichSKD4 TaxID=744980 RepID=UPI0001E56BF6|nr:pilus assembly protein N-terminal domain-containing protein [Roseibium sp. TrichSKD4]EFO33148.1 PilQ [Roseibium sp. TrichSKD4]
MRFSVGLKTALAIAAITTAVGSSAIAQEGPVTVMVDRAKVFRIQEPASTVIVGNPFIADVAMHDASTVVITGKSYGSTNLVILDDNNEPIIDEVITVKASDEGTVFVHRNTARQSYSCAPECEPTLRLGDQSESFAAVAEQATQRNSLAVNAAGGGGAGGQ